jgi:hypothetical protein
MSVTFGAQLASALAERRVYDAGLVLSKLEPHACQVHLGAEGVGFLNASFLVCVGTRQAFDAAVAELRRDLSSVADVRLFGPLPPYSFVSAPLAMERGGWAC